MNGQPRRREPAPPSDGGTLASRKAAAHLLRVPEARIDAAIRDGRVQIEAIKGTEYVDLEQLEAALAESAPGGTAS